MVDDIGIAQNLKEALRQSSAADQGQTGSDEAQAVAVLLEKYDIVAAMVHGVDYRRGLKGTLHQRLVVMAEAIEWILAQPHGAAEREKTAQGKKRAHRRYQDAVLALSKAFALAAASAAARGAADGPAGDHHRRLGAPRERPCADARAGEAYPAQIWLPAGP